MKKISYLVLYMILVLSMMVGCGQSISKDTQSFEFSDRVEEREKSINFDSKTAYKSTRFTINITNNQSEGDIVVSISDPSGNLVDEFTIATGDEFTYDEKHKGRKGIWEIKFICNGSNVNYTYDIDIFSKNLNYK